MKFHQGYGFYRDKNCIPLLLVHISGPELVVWMRKNLLWELWTGSWAGLALGQAKHMATGNKNPVSKSWIIVGSPLLGKEWKWLAARTIFLHGSQGRCTQSRRGQANPIPLATIRLSPPNPVGSWWEVLGHVEIARTLLMRLRHFLSHGNWPGFWWQWFSVSSKGLSSVNARTKQVRQPLWLQT